MPFIAVLEDDPRRIAAMRNAAAGDLADYEIQLFSNAREMERWLTTNLDQLRLLSLDCDVDSTAITDPDCGSGEDITRFLVSQPPESRLRIRRRVGRGVPTESRDQA